MPLRDHFGPPLDDLRHWEGFHATWPVMIVALVTTPNWELLRSREVGTAHVLLFQASNISMRKSNEAFSLTRNDRAIEKFCRTVRGDRAFPLYLGALPNGSAAGLVRRTKGDAMSHVPEDGSKELPAVGESQLAEVTFGRAGPEFKLFA